MLFAKQLSLLGSYMGEMGELHEVLKHVFAGKPPGWPRPYPSFLLTLLKVSVPWYPGMRYDDLWLSDPRPGVAGLAHWFWRHFEKPKAEPSASGSR